VRTLPGLRSFTGRQYATGNQQCLLVAKHSFISQDVFAFYVIVSIWKLLFVEQLAVVLVISVIKLCISLTLDFDNSSVVLNQQARVLCIKKSQTRFAAYIYICLSSSMVTQLHMRT